MKVCTAHLNKKDYAHLNVSAIVGNGGKNFRDDVLLIQGLFNYIAKSPLMAFVCWPEGKMPKMTGIFDADTAIAVFMFQVINASLLYSHKLDMRIHPASYVNRQMNNLNRLMIITRLNWLADTAALIDGKRSFVPELKKLSPELRQAINLAPWEIEK